ncbi:MAG: hypothetical protein ABIS67_07740 [Candidatus Eisenbacteria bacterium]
MIRGTSRDKHRALAASLLVLLLGLAGVHSPAFAQRPQQPFDPQRPLIIRIPTDTPPASARNLTPLEAIHMQIVRDALRERETGRLDMARKKLATLPPAIQRHPIVLTERARIELAAKNPAEVVRLATFERRARRDSLLMGHELAQAYEELRRPREASATVVEVWALAPVEENWAMEILMRLGAQDSRAGRDALRRAFSRLPTRPDLARGLSALEWTAGDLRAALKVLRSIEPPERGPRDRWAFAERLLHLGTDHDSIGATDAYVDIASDQGLDVSYRMTAARRGWELALTRGNPAGAAPRIYAALKDIPPDRWMADLALTLARALRIAGDTGAARALLGPGGSRDAARPELSLERALADLRDGPPERVLGSLRPGEGANDEQMFHYAEALFFAGQPDSALAWYQRVVENPGGAYTGAALERLFLIEDGKPKTAVAAFGRIAYEQWRNSPKRALALADSLLGTLPEGPLWAQTALLAAGERERAGDARGALALVLAVADSLPADRLAPIARQRAGDLYSHRLKDDARAIEQYEACVARYPRAWNAPEVRRRLEELRRTRRF